MKSLLKRTVAIIMTLASIGFSACNTSQGDKSNSSGNASGGGINHECNFDKKVTSSEFLKAGVTCKNPATYYYSCECGKKGTRIFYDGKALPHDFTAEVIADQYEIKKATCFEEGEYYKSCVTCGQQSYLQTFKTQKSDEHQFIYEIKSGKYIKTDATYTENAVYYKSCICGLTGDDTFLGEKLRVYTEEEKVSYMPTSLTVTLYDSENSVYGITYNTALESPRPVVQVRLKGNQDWTEYPAMVEKMTSYTAMNELFDYYITKAEIDLEPNKTYEYRAYDKYVGVGTDIATFEAKDPKTETFTFINVTDTQEGPQFFNSVLATTAGKADFLLHTGDFCQEAKYEYQWTEMLDNFSYLSKIPLMVATGNHEFPMYGDKYEVYKHFHNKVPEQNEETGSYYSFVYGNAKFIVLNTNDMDENGLRTAQYEWLVNELQNNTATWTIVAMHKVLYSPGIYGSYLNTDALLLRKQLQALFAQYNVDLVIQGHDHLISRTYPISGQGVTQTETWENENGIPYSIDPNGVIYVMNGVSGGQSESPQEGLYDSSLFDYVGSSEAAGWAEFTISGNTLTVAVKYSHNQHILQSWGIKKSAK